MSAPPDPPSSSILLYAPRADHYALFSVGYGLGSANRGHQQKMGECNWGIHPPGSLPVGPQVGSDFPLPNATAPAKGPPPCSKGPRGPHPLSGPPYSAHTFANDPFIMLSLINPWECTSDSCKDPNQHSSHRLQHHHLGFPLGRENCRKAFGSAISNTILGSLSGQNWARL